jgi:hypothetical protein
VAIDPNNSNANDMSAIGLPTLDDLIDMDVEGWRPDRNEKLVGRVALIQTAGEGSQFGSYPLLTIVRDSDGDVVNVHCFHEVLRREVARQEVGVGDHIAIKYLGLTEGGGFGKFENYRLINESNAIRTASKAVNAVRSPRPQPQQ